MNTRYKLCRTCGKQYSRGKFAGHADCPACMYAKRKRSGKLTKGASTPKLLHPLIDAFLRNPPRHA